MKVVIDIAEIARGGMERQVIQLASGLQGRGHEVRLIAQKRVSDYRAEIAEARLDVVELGRDGRTDPRVLSDLLAVMRRFRPDVAVCENFNATLWGRLAALVGGCSGSHGRALDRSGQKARGRHVPTGCSVPSRGRSLRVLRLRSHPWWPKGIQRAEFG